MDIFADDINCYAGKVEEYRWTLVSEGTMLAPVVGSPSAFVAQRVSPTRWLVPAPPLRANYELGNYEGAPWLIVENLAFVPRPVWIVEGESKDPYYNFGKVIMYFDKDMYRIYWKLVHNRAGEYFYNAMCGYTFAVSPDRTFSAVSPAIVVGVNDKANRAARPQGRWKSIGGHWSQRGRRSHRWLVAPLPSSPSVSARRAGSFRLHPFGRTTSSAPMRGHPG